MRTIVLDSYKSCKEADDAISLLKDFFKHAPDIEDALSEIRVFYQQQQQQQQGGSERRSFTPQELAEAARRSKELELEALREINEVLPRYVIVAEMAVADVAEKTERLKLPAEKKEEFTLPAFKALAEFKACVEGYPSYMCLIAFLVSLAAIVMSFAGSMKKD